MSKEAVIYVAKIAYSTSVDGVGLRNSLYVSGCPIHCKGCHNPKLWDINAGKPQTVSQVFASLNEDDFNISILGGEPLFQYDAILELCKRIKAETAKTIWMWSGYTYEHIQEQYTEILGYIDVLVDGPFIEEQKDLTLDWRGSKNQRVIKLK